MKHRLDESEELQDYSGEIFSEQERKFLRKMMEEEKRVAWFWASVRQWALWTSAVVVGIVAFRDSLKAIIMWFFK